MQPDAVSLPDGNPRILFCGSTTLDTIFRVAVLPTGPGKVLPREMAVVAHGMAASAAAAAARLGARAVLLSRLGDDATGQRICDALTAAGVDCSGVRRFAGVTSALCTVMVDDNGERLVVPYYDPTLPADPGWLPLEAVAGADAVMVDVRWPQGAAALLDAARAAGKPAVLDGDIGPRDVLLDLAGRATHAVFFRTRGVDRRGPGRRPGGVGLAFRSVGQVGCRHPGAAGLHLDGPGAGPSPAGPQGLRR